MTRSRSSSVSEVLYTYEFVSFIVGMQLPTGKYLPPTLPDAYLGLL